MLDLNKKKKRTFHAESGNMRCAKPEKIHNKKLKSTSKNLFRPANASQTNKFKQ